MLSKIKYPSAEAKRTAIELEAQWEQLKTKSYGRKMSASGTTAAVKPTRRIFKMDSVDPQMGTSRVTPGRIPSLVTGGGSTAPKAAQVYTGEQMIGITVLHKSCLQPVFSQQEAVDAATMRR